MSDISLILSQTKLGGEFILSPRTGRPTDNPKGERLTVRIDNECSQILNDYCSKNHINKGQAIREGIKKLKDQNKK